MSPIAALVADGAPVPVVHCEPRGPGGPGGPGMSSVGVDCESLMVAMLGGCAVEGTVICGTSAVISSMMRSPGTLIITLAIGSPHGRWNVTAVTPDAAAWLAGEILTPYQSSAGL